MRLELPATIRPASYQLVGLTKLLAGKTNGILLADGVGVGKTISAGYFVAWSVLREAKDALIVCPAGLVEKWRFELKSKFGMRALPLRSAEELTTSDSERTISGKSNVFVVPFSRIGLLGARSYPSVIVDEIHNYRNRESKGWKHLRAVASAAQKRMGLSATPINNALGDLSSIFSILLPRFDPFEFDAVLEEIWSRRSFDLLDPILTRFTKERLGLQFAQRVIKDVSVGYPEAYASRVRSMIGSRLGNLQSRDSYPLAAITLYREAASSPAAISASLGVEVLEPTDSKVETLREVLRRTDSHTLVFCQFTATAHYLAAKCTEVKSFVMTGENPPDERVGIIESFRQSAQGVLFLTQVGSEGLDLQFCSTVVNYDLHWNPMVLEQRVGRVDRLGQTKAQISVVNIRVRGSIDERVMEVIERKLGIVRGTPLEGSTKGVEEVPLYEFSALEAERELAERSTVSRELLEPLGATDLVGGPSIDMRACDPTKLVSMEPLQWLPKTPETNVLWLGALHRREADLLSRLDLYHQVGA